MPSAVSSRASCSSPEIRRLSSELMISAATFLPVKLAPFAAGDLQVDVNIGPAAIAPATRPTDSVTSTPSKYFVKSFFMGTLIMPLPRKNHTGPASGAAPGARQITRFGRQTDAAADDERELRTETGSHEQLRVGVAQAGLG